MNVPLYPRVMNDPIGRAAYQNTTRGILSGPPGQAFDDLAQALSNMFIAVIADPDVSHAPVPVLSTETGYQIVGRERILVAAEHMANNGHA